jgi:retron-type reverse transcriptase
MQEKKGGYPLNQSPFFKLSTKRKLAKLLGISLLELKTFRRCDRLYSERDIPKKNGGTRRIENPRRHLKVVQARIARLLSRITPPDYLFCPVKGRSYVTNAARHLGHRVVRTLDVKKYFPSTSRNRVYRFFNTVMRCNSDVAEILTGISTYKGHLPTGSPLSPIMAFYAHYDIWQEVYRLVTNGAAINSLYIDDLTISGERVSDSLIWDIKKAIYRSGLRYHKEKTFRDRPAEITGVIVRDGRLLPPNRQLLKKFRSECAARKATTKLEKEMLTTQLKGLAGQVAQIKSANVSLK